MRTRAAILSMLALGFLLSTTGAGLAVGGLADNDQASKAQYPPTTPETTTPPPTTPESVPTPPDTSTPTTPPSGGGALPEENESAPEQENTPPTDEVLPDTGNAPEQSEVQPARQLETTSAPSSLPFTGFAALPVLLLGLALLAGGLVMRRSTRAD